MSNVTLFFIFPHSVYFSAFRQMGGILVVN